MANLTEGDRKILNLAWQCFKEPPQIDYKKLQEVGGYKTAASATSVYLAAKKKIIESPPLPLTDGDRKVLDKALLCVKELPKVDYKKLQEKGGYKTTASATSVYLAARKKLLNGAGVNTAPAAKAKGGAGKKRKIAKVDGDADDEEDGDVKAETAPDLTEEPTDDVEKKPKKRAKKGKGKAAGENVDETDEALVDESVDAKPKKRGKKSAAKKAPVESSADVEAFPDDDAQAPGPGNRPAEDADVYTSLFASTTQYLEDHTKSNVWAGTERGTEDAEDWFVVTPEAP